MTLTDLAPPGQLRTEECHHVGGGINGIQHQYRRVSGTWRRDGSQLYVQFDPVNARFNGCYSVMTGAGGAVHLTGPQFLEGRLYGGSEPARATTPGVAVGERQPPGPKVSPRAMPGR